ncbi:hypothetical protein D918_08693 [Trichuris suis]|nr:hypothetical protein D918_08693 [Trichuris suis]
MWKGSELNWMQLFIGTVAKSKSAVDCRLGSSCSVELYCHLPDYVEHGVVVIESDDGWLVHGEERRVHLKFGFGLIGGFRCIFYHMPSKYILQPFRCDAQLIWIQAISY